jgi:uncharacterized membrane protein (DUF106 family)
VHDWIGEINTWLYGIASASVGAIIVLVRKINTNEKQIELLKREIATREEFRKERDEEIKGQLKELRSDVKALMQTFK